MNGKLMRAGAALLTAAALAVPAVAVAERHAPHAAPAAAKTKTKAKAKAKAKAKTPRGPRGPRGRTGKTGKTGKPGKNGRPGRDGATGPMGPAGAPGANGASGANGVNGANGASGAASGSALVRTIIVSPTAADSAGDGALLLAAVRGIGGTSQGNPYLVEVEPGVYDLGAATLTLPAWVDLQGAGQDMTRIESSAGVALSAAASTEVRGLTVVDSDSAGSAVAIATGGGLRALTAIAYGTTEADAVVANDTTMPLIDVTASASAAPGGSANAVETTNPVAIQGGSYTASVGGSTGTASGLSAGDGAVVRGATLAADGGATAYAVALTGSAATVQITSSTLSGGGGLNVPAGDTLEIGGSQVPGVTAGTGRAICPDDWLPSYATAGSACH